MDIYRGMAVEDIQNGDTCEIVFDGGIKRVRKARGMTYIAQCQVSHLIEFLSSRNGDDLVEIGVHNNEATLTVNKEVIMKS